MHNMDAQDANLHIPFDEARLVELAACPESCIDVVARMHHMAVAPLGLVNFLHTISELLNVTVTKYSNDLSGIVCGYRILRWSDNGSILPEESQFICVDVDVEFFVFRPVENSEMHAMVNKKSATHVGCLVHGMFNVSIPQPQTETDWMGHHVHKGQEIFIRIIRTDFNGVVPYIEGDLISISSNDSGFGTSEETKPIANEHKRKKSKKRHLSVDGEEEIMPSPKQKKKRTYGTLEQPVYEQEEDSTTPHKQKKIRKSCALDQSMDEQEQQSMPTMTPKKRRKSCALEPSVDGQEEQNMLTSNHKQTRESYILDQPADKKVEEDTLPVILKKRRKSCALEQLVDEREDESMPISKHKKTRESYTHDQSAGKQAEEGTLPAVLKKRRKSGALEQFVDDQEEETMLTSKHKKTRKSCTLDQPADKQAEECTLPVILKKRRKSCALEQPLDKQEDESTPPAKLKKRRKSCTLEQLVDEQEEQTTLPPKQKKIRTSLTLEQSVYKQEEESTPPAKLKKKRKSGLLEPSSVEQCIEDIQWEAEGGLGSNVLQNDSNTEPITNVETKKRKRQSIQKEELLNSSASFAVDHADDEKVKSKKKKIKTKEEP